MPSPLRPRSCELKPLAESLPIVKIEVSLAENASQRADRDFVLPGHNGGDRLSRPSVAQT
jgi:hypothetical protein